MQLVHDFGVSRPIEQAWQVLTDVESIVPCLPGAQLTEVEGDRYRGLVKVKVGPMVAQFAGQAQFRELDATRHRAVLEGRGKEGGGRGMASVVVTAELTAHGEHTEVHVVIDLTISGRLAQFGQGTMAEVSTKLLGQFVDCLEQTVLARSTTTTAATAADSQPLPASQPAPQPQPTQAFDPAHQPTQPSVRAIDSPAAKPVDLLSSAAAPVLKRLLPALVIVAVLVIVLVLVLN